MERAGAVFAPIPSLRSCAAYRPAALRRRNRQAACAKKAIVYCAFAFQVRAIVRGVYNLKCVIRKCIG